MSNQLPGSIALAAKAAALDQIVRELTAIANHADFGSYGISASHAAMEAVALIEVASSKLLRTSAQLDAKTNG